VLLTVSQFFCFTAALGQQTTHPNDAWPGAFNGGLKLAYLHWYKVCSSSDQIPSNHDVCATGRDAIDECGRILGAAVLIEPKDGHRKTLRVAVPDAIKRQDGVRMAIDEGKPISADISACFSHWCFADYEATPSLIEKLNDGRDLVVAATNHTGSESSFSLPLTGFADSNAGSGEPKFLEYQKDDIQAEIERWSDLKDLCR
jgi:invasion protein IalB